MRILYYCQHVLGVGHFHRSLEICRACSQAHQVTMIVGGPDISVANEPFDFLKLPGLQMDDTFSGLTSCDPRLGLEEVKQMRINTLLSFFKSTKPDCLILELYPFGRKAFRFELNPLLEAARAKSTMVLCSLRDILVEKKTDRTMWEDRVVATLNNYFNGLLVHADPRLVTLDYTFGPITLLDVPVHYTGFITPKPRLEARPTIRAELGLGPGDAFIVASIGSGSVGSHLLEAVAAAAHCDHTPGSFYFHLFTGPYCPPEVIKRLRAATRQNLVVEQFTDHFIDWLAAADLSVSMAGYNTSMNSLAAGVPALMLPFDQNREQRLRVERLIGEHPIKILDQMDLAPEQLADLIVAQAQESRYQTELDLDGARRTVSIIEGL
ncbi:MAG: glycosyl transferase [Desulfofustis sp.]|nr:glycosyl transferase [Desulfofustis sp.]